MSAFGHIAFAAMIVVGLFAFCVVAARSYAWLFYRGRE